MAKSFRVSHITRNYSLNFDQVEKAIRQHSSFVCVEPGKTFIDATFAEVAAWRKAQAPPEFEPLAHAEIPGLRYEPAPTNLASTRQSYAILKQANQFAQANA